MRRLLQIRGFQLLRLTDALAIRASELAADLRLRGVDAVFVAAALQLNIPLVTFDHEILTRASGTIEVFSPVS